MTADPRVTAARAFLAEAKQRKFAGRPNSVLVREAAELRHQLGQVLKAIDESTMLAAAPRPRVDGSVGESSFVACDGSGILTPADVQTVLGALSIAARWADLTSRSGASEKRLDDRDQAAASRALSNAPGAGPLEEPGAGSNPHRLDHQHDERTGWRRPERRSCAAAPGRARRAPGCTC